MTLLFRHKIDCYSSDTMGIGDKFFGLRGKKLGWMIGFCAGMDFLLFGYGTRLSTSDVPLAQWKANPWQIKV